MMSDTYDNFVWDGHSGFTMMPDVPLDPLLRPWRDAGVNYLSVNVYYDPQPWTDAADSITAVQRRLPSEVPYCQLATSIEDISKAKSEGKLAVAFDIEGMNALNGDIDLVQRYYGLGVRQMAIAYNRNNLAGSGCHDEDSGLTDFGREVIHELNRVGMVIDCSHAGIKTTMDAMDSSTHPVVFSHSNPRALVDHERNITDEQIRTCAEIGGVIGMTGVNLFLGENEASPAAIARHAAYVAELTSPKHVGISLDFDPQESKLYSEDASNTVMEERDMQYWPKGAGYDRPAQTLNVSRLKDVTEALAEVGFSTDEISGILGGNFARVAKQVWK